MAPGGVANVIWAFAAGDKFNLPADRQEELRFFRFAGALCRRLAAAGAGAIFNCPSALGTCRTSAGFTHYPALSNLTLTKPIIRHLPVETTEIAGNRDFFAQNLYCPL